MACGHIVSQTVIAFADDDLFEDFSYWARKHTSIAYDNSLAKAENTLDRRYRFNTKDPMEHVQHT